jgi:hypothetical protein
LNFTPAHQSFTITPQNGSTTLGFAVIFAFEDFVSPRLFALSRFFDAFERLDTTETPSKSKSFIASSTPHVNTPSLSS